MRLSNRERTSQRPSPKLSTNGFPTGHAYCTVRMSVPMILQSSFDNPFSHSRLGLEKDDFERAFSFHPQSSVLKKIRLSNGELITICDEFDEPPGAGVTD